MLKKKWQGHFERQRQKTGTQKSKKGGRPRKVMNAVDLSPGIRTTGVMSGTYIES